MLSTADDFLAHLRHDRAYAETTLAGYRADLLAALDHFARAGLPPDVHAVQRDHVRDFLRLPTRRGDQASPRTRNRRLAVLRAFFAWARAEGLVTEDPTDGLPWSRVRPRDPPSFAEADLRAMVEAARANPHRWHAVRDEALLVLLAATGLRLSEVTGLNVEQVDLVDARLRGVLRKGGARKDLVVNAEVVRVLGRWMELRAARDLDDERALFLSRQRRRLSRRMVQLLVHRYAHAAGIEATVTPHVFRHTFGYLVQKRGAAMRSAQELLNHARIQTTALYSRATEADLRRAVQALEDLTRPEGATDPSDGA